MRRWEGMEKALRLVQAWWILVPAVSSFLHLSAIY